MDNIDIEPEKLRRILDINESAPAALRILLTEERFREAYIVGEGCVIECQTVSVLDSLMNLLAFYYVMDLNYPAIYGQLLGFLQQHVLEEPYTFTKGANFLSFSTKVSNIELA